METQRELNNIFTIAAKEFKDYVKSKRFILVGILYAVMALAILAITLLIFNDYKSAGMESLFKPSMVLSYMDILNLILVLLAVIITADTISVEMKDRTIYQLLSKPVERSTVVLGKFAGCLGVISFFFASSSLLAYVLVIILSGVYPSATDAMSVLVVIVFMILMFSVYVALGILISTITKNPLISILGGIIVWVVFFMSNTIGDLVGRFSSGTGNTIILGVDQFPYYPIYAKVMVWINPISHDIVNVLLGSTGDVVGMPVWGNVIFLVAYTAILLLISTVIFNRRDI